MLSTKNIVLDVKDVPNSWIFSYYCKIPLEWFNGQEFKIKSIFNQEKTASMSFYIYKGDYRYNDFSSGNKGSGIDLVMSYKNLNFNKAALLILKDYANNKPSEIISNNFEPVEKYKVSNFSIRKFNVLDKQFWTSFNINSTILDRFNVKALDYYEMTKDLSQITISGEYLYGYFTDNTYKELYKIYQPKSDLRFIKVISYIQGQNQLKGSPFMIYTSSLKDIMSITSFDLNIDLKAPDSENTFLPDSVIKEDLIKYKKVLTLFDSDDPGIKAAYKYKEMYRINPMFLAYGEKDPSDHINTFGAKKTKYWIINLLHKHLNQ